LSFLKLAIIERYSYFDIMKIVHINKEKIEAEQGVKDLLKKFKERDKKKAQKMFMQQDFKKKVSQ
jgi:hypothetical protein